MTTVNHHVMLISDLNPIRGRRMMYRERVKDITPQHRIVVADIIRSHTVNSSHEEVAMYFGVKPKYLTFAKCLTKRKINDRFICPSWVINHILKKYEKQRAYV